MFKKSIEKWEEEYKELLSNLADRVVEELKSSGYNEIIKEVRIDNLQTLVVEFDDEIANDGKQDMIGVLAYGGAFKNKKGELVKVPPNDTVKEFIEG